ncbi:sulfurtransferase [Myxococcota bacterium]
MVSTDWLQANLEADQLVVIDVRRTADYELDHIPDAVSEPFGAVGSAWVTQHDDLLLEVPESADLFATIGALGISTDSWVVIVTGVNPEEPEAYGLAAATRVADTLIYAGVTDVAILDGGHAKWVANGLPTTVEEPAVTPVTYDGTVNDSMFVSAEYVQSRIGRAVILDARDPEVYFGAAEDQFADKLGHIPSARSLPAPWLWYAEDNTYADSKTLSAMVSDVVGPWKNQEIIVYCSVGGYASSWWFVLSQMLGYKNVRFYDGSAEEWVRDREMVAYRWY